MTDDGQDNELAALEKVLLDKSADPVDLPFSLLKAITGNFSEDNKIGSGGFGAVYKGVLPSGRTIAVKKLFERFEILDKNFESEIACLVGVKHKNTVRFLGYCSETQHVMRLYEGRLVWADMRQRLLCFEYLPKGCLADFLSDASCKLKWSTNYQIIKGICEGVHYLHQQRIIHMDLKPENVLLDDNMVPRIVDFGLSRRLRGSQSRAITENKLGTMGYMAPEFLKNGEITFKTDIYSLGIIIMEILMGHKECSNAKEVVESWTNKLGTSKSQTTLKQVKVCADIGIKCTNSDPGYRPATCFIIRLFEELCEVEFSNWSLENDVVTSTKGQISFASQLINELKLMDNSAASSHVQPSMPVEQEDSKLSLERKGKGATVTVSMSTVAISTLGGKLTTLGAEYNKRKEVREQASFLTMELSTINAAFEQLELIDKLAPWVKNWRDDVREIFMHDGSSSVKGSLGAVVKLLPCDHEVTGSCPENSLLQKCSERLGTKDPKWSDPSPDPAQAVAMCIGPLTVSSSVHKSVLYFSTYEVLQVLDLDECGNQLGDNHLKAICSNLLLLRFLCLGAAVKALSEGIKNLRFLRTLVVRTQIQILPAGVLKLPYLTHLFGKFKLQQGVRGRRMLKLQTSKLQTVAGFVVDSNNNSHEFAQLMEHMKHLTKVKIWCEQSTNRSNDPIASRSNLSCLSESIKGFIKRSTGKKLIHSH